MTQVPRKADRKWQEVVKVVRDYALERLKEEGIPDRVPHYTELEYLGHEIGQALSREIQACGAAVVAARVGRQADCPECGRPCPVDTTQREVATIDGRLELTEARAYCRRCRRNFFPSASSPWPG